MNALSAPAQSAQRPLAPAASPAPLRVCHLSMTLNTGGLERLLVDFSRFRDARKFELCFVALEQLGPPADDLRQAGHFVHTLNLSETGKMASIRELARILKERQIDVLHTHNTYPHFYGALAAKLAGVPQVINTQHGRGCGQTLKSLWQFRIANLFARRIVGVSEDAAQLCRNQDWLSAGRMQCIWNGIDVDRFQYVGPQSAPCAISVARLSPEKDFSTLLRATRIVVQEHPEFRLKIVGDGTERPKLERLVRELNIQDHVEFLGERRDVPQLLQTAGFFVSSSKTEGISLTLLEAMAVGLPIVATRVGGNPEIVIDDVTGKLVPSLNPDALAAAMNEMLAASDAWAEMGQAARTRIESHFDVRRMVTNYEALYLEGATQNRRAASAVREAT